MFEISIDTGGTWDFAFAAGLLYGCGDNQDIMDGSCRFCGPAGDFRPFHDEHDDQEIQPISLKEGEKQC